MWDDQSSESRERKREKNKTSLNAEKWKDLATELFRLTPARVWSYEVWAFARRVLASITTTASTSSPFCGARVGGGAVAGGAGGGGGGGEERSETERQAPF